MPTWRSSSSWLLFVACALLSLVMLDMLARHQLREHLDQSAIDTLGALLHADTPHRWSARSSADIIAGRAFGTEDASFTSDGFQVRSQGQAIQIGLILASDMDLTRYTRLAIALHAEQAGSLALIVGESLHEQTCRSQQTSFTAGSTNLDIDIRTIGWTCQGKPSSAPKRAAMLRLSLELPAQTTATVDNVRAQTHVRLDPASLNQLAMPLLPDPRNKIDFKRGLTRAAENSAATAWPILQLPLDSRVEQSLQARDQIRDAIPDALIVPLGDFQRVANQALSWQATPLPGETSRSRWLLLGVYITLLVALRIKPPIDPRLRAGLELLAATVVPMVMIIGGYIGDDLSPVVLGACVATLVFALSLLIGDAPAEPSARTLKRGWWVALMSLGLSIALILELSGGHITNTWPGFPRLFRYLAWAAVQQFLICVIVAERIERVSGSSRIALLGAALVFALLHTPNAMLMQLTFVAGLIWIWNWQRHRALLANIVAHAFSGLLLAGSLPPQWLHSAEISARFFL
ncbi:MAG TPA: CPBP family intramembrane glutamic endopeptidase [Dokdonella sp.]|uniref:CPBP family intramembrane glutamic endopeptidase n=1 Tax=Dokdonella sp. TaxID=2291710 RepID=UPI002D7ECE98|nr:lysostaphin resistance A-like protein [Dokdonella sp.]HET9032465.1 CPBP family intramembrane glutamic endopeptidase [Dokdonella sp.]